jgi:HlyD family secretion protein
MKPKFLVLIALVIVITLALIFAFGRRRQFLYAGTVEATEVDLSSRLTAVISEFNVKEGDVVKKGEVVVKLSSEDLVVAADAAERDYRRASELLKAGSLNQEAFDRIKFKRDDAMVKLGWCTVSAPLDATVITRFHEPGELVNPGTKLVRLADLNTVWAYVYIPQPMLSQVSLGMDVPSYIPESGMKNIAGKIVKINEEAEFTPKNVQTRKERTRLVYGVKIEFNNAGGDLKPGMSVEAQLPH